MVVGVRGANCEETPLRRTQVQREAPKTTSRAASDSLPNANSPDATSSASSLPATIATTSNFEPSKVLRAPSLACCRYDTLKLVPVYITPPGIGPTPSHHQGCQLQCTEIQTFTQVCFLLSGAGYHQDIICLPNSFSEWLYSSWLQFVVYCLLRSFPPLERMLESTIYTF